MRAHALCPWILGAAMMASCDPVHEAQKDAIGGDTPGVPNGPLHHPGQACIVCHDGALTDPSAFSVGGDGLPGRQRYVGPPERYRHPYERGRARPGR